MNNMASAYNTLAIPIQRWIWQKGWSSLNEIQEKSIPIILEGTNDVIISAATACGKTEAVFFPVLTSIINENSIGCSAIYISPLKSLINDQYRRLIDLTCNTNISITPWHQDVSMSQKLKFSKNPSNILIITPESLESILVNKRHLAEIWFSSLKYIIIDEFHAFIGTERGTQLQSILSRIETLASRIIPRIAMSATFADFENVKQHLRNINKIPCHLITQEGYNQEVKLYIKEFLESEQDNPIDTICLEIFNKLRGTNNLIFVNYRDTAEQLTIKLEDLSRVNNVPNEFRIHHGSLSKEIRTAVEKELQEGLYPITAICTSTMELGVDIGKVKSIMQIGVANSVSSIRQRLGRSGRRGDASILRIISIDSINQGLMPDLCYNLFQNIAVLELLLSKTYETSTNEDYHFSTLIQQLLSLIASYGSIKPREAWEILCPKGTFKDITSSLFIKLLYCLGDKKVISQLDSGPLIVGIEGEKLIQNRDFYSTFIQKDEYTVLNINGYGCIGTLEISECKSVPEIGSIITLGGRHWRIIKFQKFSKTFYVTQTEENGESFFDGTTVDVSPVVIQKMRDVYLQSEIYAYLDRQAKELLKQGRAFFIKNNLQDTFILYNGKPVFLTWAGAKVNRTIVLIKEFYLGSNCDHYYDNILINEFSWEDARCMLKHPKPNGVDLACLIKMKEVKIIHKYDYLLTDDLLNISYAKSSLEVDKAWQILQEGILKINR